MDIFIPKLLVVIANLLLTKLTAATVEILEPYHPYYVKVGDSMEIKCVSSNDDLEWTRSTPETAWSNVKIEPKEGEDWKIRTTVEQPSGFVESVLVKDNMQLQDRGNYYCRDTKNIASFSIWVTTLQVYHRNITAVEDQEEIAAYCILTGFDMNPPPMFHEWYFQNEPIPYDSPRHFYHVNETEVNRLGIVIKKPKKEDTGWYQCRFTLETNISPLDIVDQFYVNTSRLPSSGSIKSSAYQSLHCITMLMFILRLRHYIV